MCNCIGSVHVVIKGPLLMLFWFSPCCYQRTSYECVFRVDVETLAHQRRCRRSKSAIQEKCEMFWENGIAAEEVQMRTVIRLESPSWLPGLCVPLSVSKIGLKSKN